MNRLTRRSSIWPPRRPSAAIRGVGGAVLLIAALLGSAPPLQAQQPTAPPPADTTARPDPRLAEPPEQPLPHSPFGAFLRSVAVPGWGQLWVGAPVRGGVYFGLEAGTLFMVLRNRGRLGDARDAQERLRESGELDLDATTGLVRSREQQVEDWTALAIFLALFSGADAYVAAQLADFDEHVGVNPRADGATELRFSVPVGRTP